MLFQKLFQSLSANPRKIFLIDGIGAAVSACFLGILLISFQEYIGMPTWALTILSLIALLFAIYSFSCFFWVNQNQRFFLRIIAFSNFIYCLITSLFLIQFFKQLSNIGLVYFIFELLIILTLTSIEFRICRDSEPKSEELL